MKLQGRGSNRAGREGQAAPSPAAGWIPPPGTGYHCPPRRPTKKRRKKKVVVNPHHVKTCICISAFGRAQLMAFLEKTPRAAAGRGARRPFAGPQCPPERRAQAPGGRLGPATVAGSPAAASPSRQGGGRPPLTPVRPPPPRLPAARGGKDGAGGVSRSCPPLPAEPPRC